MKKSKGEKRYAKNRYHEWSELLTEKDVEMLTKHFGAIGIDVKTKELG